MGTLYLVATPIGNLQDMTLRAVQTLKDVALIAAEDTRSAHILLAHFQISKPVTSYFEHNKLQKLDAILGALVQGDVAVISEAGMPGLSDPGYELVCTAIANNLRVVPIPGPNALTTALVASGLPTDQFIYLGFLPREKTARRRFLRSVESEPRTLVAYEAPHRVRASLDDIAQVMGNRSICVARELTKVHEEFFRGTVSAASEHFITHEPRGEFVFVIQGQVGSKPTSTAWTKAHVKKEMARLMKQGLSRTDAAKRVAKESRWDRREIYRITLKNS